MERAPRHRHLPRQARTSGTSMFSAIPPPSIRAEATLRLDPFCPLLSRWAFRWLFLGQSGPAALGHGANPVGSWRMTAASGSIPPFPLFGPTPRAVVRRYTSWLTGSMPRSRRSGRWATTNAATAMKPARGSLAPGSRNSAAADSLATPCTSTSTTWIVYPGFHLRQVVSAPGRINAGFGPRGIQGGGHRGSRVKNHPAFGSCAGASTPTGS